MTESEASGSGPRWPNDLSAVAAELDALFRRNPYSNHLGVELDDWGLGWARTKATPPAATANIVSTVHGGMFVGLADAAFEIACNSYGRRCVAIELTVHFAAAGEIGTPLVAEAREVSRSARLASYTIEVTKQGQDPAPVATLLALAYRTQEWHLGADRYPEEWRKRY